MTKKKRCRILSFLLAVVMMASSLVSNVPVVFAQEPEPAEHGISVLEAEYGTVTVKDGLSMAGAGTEVRVFAQAQEGYKVNQILVNGGDVEISQIPDSESEYQFMMPDSDVQIQAEFIKEEVEGETENEASLQDSPDHTDQVPVENEDTKEEETQLDTVSGNDASDTVSGGDALEGSLEESTEDPAATPEGESNEPQEKITGVYFEFQNTAEILELAEKGLDLEEFFQYSIWGFLTVEDLRCLVANNMELEDLYDVLEGEVEAPSAEIQAIVEKYQQIAMPQRRMSTFAARSTVTSSTATVSITGNVSDSSLGTIPAFGSGDHGNMLRITLDGYSAFCALYGASCRSGMTYTKVSGDEIGIDRSQQYLLYRIIGWYYEAQQINDNTGNYAITQAAVWLVRNGQWSDAATMAAAIKPMIEKVLVLDDATSLALFEGMANWVNDENNQPQVGIDFWYNGPNQYLVTVGGDTYVETEDPEYSAHVKIYKTDAVTGNGINSEAQFKIYTEDGTDTGATFSKSGHVYTSSTLIKDEEHSTFYVQEVGVPTGYLGDSGRYYFTINDGDDDAEKVITNNGSSFANNPMWVQLTLTKTDAVTEKYLEGNAEFVVGSDRGNMSQTVTFTKQANGTYLSSKVYYNESNQGQFYLQEAKAPKGYNTDTQKYYFTVDAQSHGTTKTITNNGVNFENQPYWIQISIPKVDAVTGMALEGNAAFMVTAESGNLSVPVYFQKQEDGSYLSSKIFYNESNLGKFYVQETKAVEGYELDSKKYSFTIEEGDHGKTKKITNQGEVFGNQPFWVQILVPKTDSETLNAIAHNAQFTVTALNGTLSQPVTFEKNADGSYLSSKVYYNESNKGQFYLQETKAPENYYGDWADEEASKIAGSNTNKEKYAFTVSKDTHKKTLTITNQGESFTNERVKGTVTVFKIDVEAGKYVAGDIAHGDASLDGAVYGLYAKEDILYPDGTSGVKYPKGALVTQGTIENGKLIWEDLYLGSYYVKEITPPTGYLKDTKEYPITLTYEDETVEVVTDSTTVDEQVMKQAFRLLKMEGENQNEQEGLAGAGFKVYLLSDLGIDAAGKSDATLIQEVMEKYPDYAKGLDESTLAKVYENDMSVILSYNTKQEAVGGTGLTAIGENHYQLNEIFTNDAGYMDSPELAYGTYVVVETTVPDNELIQIKPFIVHIDKDSREVQYQRYFLDRDFTAKVKVVKMDADTGKTVLQSGISYKIYDLDNEEYVQIPVVVDNKEVFKEVFTSDEEGYILTDAALPCGRYRIEEVQGPEGFYNEFVGTSGSLGAVEFELNADQAYEMSQVSGDAVITFTYPNKETRGLLTIEKIGELLVGADNVTNLPEEHRLLDLIMDSEATENEDVQFIYEKLPLVGAEYTIKAAEDIYTQDNQVDENGDRTLWFKAGETVAVVVTGEDGQIDSFKYPTGGYTEHPIVSVVYCGETGQVSLTLPLGSYEITETKAPYGFLHTDEVKKVTFTWDNQSEEVVFNSTPATDETGMTTFENERVKPIPEEDFGKIGVGIYKKDQDTKEPIEGTVFGLYTSDNIYNVYGNLIVPADTLLAEATTDADGFAYFDVDIPYMSEAMTERRMDFNTGDYYIVEHAVPEGIFLDSTPLYVHFEYEDEHTPFVVVNAKQENVSTSVDILKTDLKTMKPLDGAVLQVIEKATGEVVHEFTSGEESTNIRRLKLSTEETEHIYILREKQPAPGYVTADDMEFKLIQATDEEGNPLMKADVYVLQDADVTSKQSGMIKSDLEGAEEAVTYVTWELENDRLTMYINEDLETEVLEQVVRESDFAGLTFKEVYFATGKLDGFYEELVVKETILSAIVNFFTGDDEAETSEAAWVKTEDATVVMKDDVTKVLISKYDIADGKSVVGAKMEIRDSAGNVIESWSTTEEEYYIEQLPVGDYVLSETLAPTADGYVKAEDIHFTVEDDGSIQKVKMADDYTKLDLAKVDVAGEEIPGAHMVLKDAEGNIVDEWDSTEEPHRIERIQPGKYTLIEEIVPDTYVQAEEITFVVEESGEVQKVEMTDKYTRVLIQKLDTNSKAPLKGATLAILNEAGEEVYTWVSDGTPYRIERIPHGKYTLVEKVAPAGYYKTEDIAFEITTEDIDNSVIMLDEPIPEPEPEPEEPPAPTPPAQPIPKLGFEDGNLYLAVAVMLLSGSALIALVVIRAKRRKNRNKK